MVLKINQLKAVELPCVADDEIWPAVNVETELDHSYLPH